MYCNRLYAWWSTQSRLASLLSSFTAYRWAGLQILWQFQIKDLFIDEMVGTWCFDAGGSDFRLYDGSSLKAYLLMRW